MAVVVVWLMKVVVEGMEQEQQDGHLKGALLDVGQVDDSKGEDERG